MVKALNVIFGIGLAVILFLVILLGVRAFYPEPDYAKSCPQTVPYVMIPCDSSVSETECNLHQQIEQQKYRDSLSVNQDCSDKYVEESGTYRRNLFFIYGVFTVILLIASFFIISIIHMSAGVALAGIALSITGFAVGWRSTNDSLKFLFGLVILAVVVWLAYAVNKKLSN